MRLAIPVSVKLLHRGNKELSRNLSSYLSLAAINNAEILAPHVQPIMDSIIGGNYSLVRVLPKIYSAKDGVLPSCKEAIHDHVMALVCLLPAIETPDKLSLLNLFLLISKNKPSVLESNLPLFSEYLMQPQTAYQTLQIFLDMAKANPAPFVEYTDRVMQACDLQVGMLSLAAQFLGIVVRGRQDIDRAKCCIDFFVDHLSKSDLSTFIALLREIKSIVEVFPILLPTIWPQLISETEHSTSNTVQNYLAQLAQLNQQVTAVTAAGGTVFRVNCDNPNLMSSNYVRSNANATETLMRNLASNNSAKLTSSNSHVFHRSIPRLHVVSGGHIIGRHLSSSSNGVHMRSLTALQLATNSSSRQQMNRMSTESMNVANSSQRSPSSSCGYLTALAEKEAMKSSKTVATSVDSQLQSASNLPSCISSTNYSSMKGSRSELTVRQKDKCTLASSDRKDPGSLGELQQQRDTLQQFCEKHIDKIKAFMFKVFVKIPLPEKCTIEEKRTKKVAKLHFICQAGQSGCRSEHCLYSKTFFVMKTRNARLWIHLMFLALQSKAPNALSTKDADVAALKNCWDALKADNKTFLTLVTSSFPSSKDQDLLMNELRSARYFDVFEFNAIANVWGCFLCNHPDRACEYMQNEPVIEGQLKEKKGKWKLFKRWRTRYFTLSGLQLSYREVDDSNASTAAGPSAAANDLQTGDTHAIGVGEIRSVRALGSSRGRRIPKAFEIFTEDKTYRLKAKNTEQWVQCLSIAMAHSQAKEVS